MHFTILIIRRISLGVYWGSSTIKLLLNKIGQNTMLTSYDVLSFIIQPSAGY